MIKESFIKNHLPYTLIKRNDFVAIYGVGGTYTNKILHYEILQIHIRNDMYGYRKALPNNEEFGKDKSRAIVNYQDALIYYDELNNKLQNQIK